MQVRGFDQVVVREDDVPDARPGEGERGGAPEASDAHDERSGPGPPLHRVNGGLLHHSLRARRLAHRAASPGKNAARLK